MSTDKALTGWRVLHELFASATGLFQKFNHVDDRLSFLIGWNTGMATNANP